MAVVVGCQCSKTQGSVERAAATESIPTPLGEHPVQALSSSSDSTPTAEAKTVKVIGYINVSSGCQQTTVNLLKQLDAKHEKLTVELIDFGESEGNRRWRADGYNCMTILINGHSTVTFGEKGKRRIVTFQYPPGFQWTHEDLTEAINAALAGTIYYGEEAGATRVEVQRPQLRITSREAILKGQKVGEVLVNGQVAIRLRTTFDGLPPLQRAEQTAARLKRALAVGFTPSELRVAKVNDGIAVVVKDKVLCIADAPQAQALATTPEALAKSWIASLKKALVTAMGGE